MSTSTSTGEAVRDDMSEENRAKRWPAPVSTPTSLARGPLVERARHNIGRTFRDLRFVADRPPGLLEHLAYARRGEWTEELDGPLRTAAFVYAWAVAIPVSIAVYLLVWCTARPGRFATALAIGIAVSSTLARLSVVGALIPGWAHL
jgi:hypothetical protein